MAFLAGLLIGHDIGERLRCAGRRDQLHLDILAADVQRSILLVGIPDVGRAGPLAAGLAHDDPGFNQTMLRQVDGAALRMGGGLAHGNQFGVGSSGLGVIEGLVDRRAHREIERSGRGVGDLLASRHIDSTHLERVVGEQGRRQVVRNDCGIERHRAAIAANGIPGRQLGRRFGNREDDRNSGRGGRRWRIVAAATAGRQDEGAQRGAEPQFEISNQ
ncbi:MAG: hypothetical protein BWX79_02771 [Alphaproteobacteria bacterium ADurb.Bin100]|nr:MAG: hypothetical protein BWX79_02771 [Alphaproteobacteria bacterium ADurb.Bin100]